MPIYKCAITKELSFQGRVEDTANVYTFDAATDDEEQLEAIGNQLVTSEKTIFSTSVTFTGLQIWDAGNPPNYMRVSELLSGAGSQSETSGMYRECAVLVYAPLPRRQGLLRTVRRDMRKFLHTGNSHGRGANGATAGEVAPSTGVLAAYLSLLSGTLLHGAKLCAPNGDYATGPWKAAPYLEHRQFPRGRKQS